MMELGCIGALFLKILNFEIFKHSLWSNAKSHSWNVSKFYRNAPYTDTILYCNHIRCNYIKSQIGLSNRNVNPKWYTRIYLSHTVYCIYSGTDVNSWTAKWRLVVMNSNCIRMVQAKRKKNRARMCGCFSVGYYYTETFYSRLQNYCNVLCPWRRNLDSL